jgi:endonuclease/exonuclease/phosphatase family metal-dependent hydrolase
MNPLRASVCTYNLWNTERWPAREPALRQFLERFSPDILGVQELRAETRDCIDETLPGHERVDDDFYGWTCESNLWWRASLFEYGGHGAVDYGSHEVSRRLFWVRLARRDRHGTVVAATAHLTHTSHPDEAATGRSPRIDQAHAIVAAMDSVVYDGEPAFVMGDFNDAYHPSRILHEAGYISCFAALSLQPPATFPAVPTANPDPGAHQYNACFDWITANRHARPLAAHSPHCYHGDTSPSDHWPIVAVYELPDGDNRR